MPTCPSCGYDPPMPVGYVYLHDDEVTPAMRAWSLKLDQDSRTNYGDEFDQTFIMKDGAQGIVTARVEHHTWTTDAQGNQVCGCYKGISLLHSPLRAPAFPPGPGQPVPIPENGSSIGTIMGYVSLGVVLFSTTFGIVHAVLSARRRPA